MNETNVDMHYLKLLSERYPSVEDAVRAIVDMSANLKLPKGTEYYFSDLHGEHEAFIHLLRSGSGNIRDKIEMLYANTLSEADREDLASLIYYPTRFLLEKQQVTPNFDEWCNITMNRLVPIFREVSSKYTRARIVSAMKSEYRPVLDELLYTDNYDSDKSRYFQEIISSSIRAGIGIGLIDALCHLIQHMTVNNLHILGDLFDRGPRADLIFDELMRYNDVDFQWGNHDIDWIGAVAGSRVCMFSVLRIAISYNAFDQLEDGYGINLRPLNAFAEKTYADDPCTRFRPHLLDENKYDPVDERLAAQMHKAVAVILFKLEGQLVKRHPEYHMEHRLLLDKMDLERGVITIDGKEYPLTDTCFPTIDPNDPYALSPDEASVVEGFAASFRHSTRLQQHIRFLMERGGMYRVINGNLLFHGCIPMEEDGSFTKVDIFPGKMLSGRALLDYMDSEVRKAYYTHDMNACDLCWYLWSGANSPLFGKDRMTTFERYFVEDKSIAKEKKNAYYDLYENRDSIGLILKEFGLDPDRDHIINGHVPVKSGESPVKAGGRLFVIDGGISKAYQSTTGIAGYTLIFDSHGLKLAEHKPFRPETADSPAETFTTTKVVERLPHRMTVGETDIGRDYRRRIMELEQLVQLYRDGIL